MTHNFAIWNIRGAHSSNKLEQVKYLINHHNVSFFAILKTKLNEPLPVKAARYINPSWNLYHNLDQASYGRIMIIHDLLVMSLSSVLSTDQVMHLHAKLKNSSTSFYISIVYAHNSVNSIQTFLNLLPAFRQNSHPWLVFGDFNCCYKLQDKHGGSPLLPKDIFPLNKAIDDACLLPIPSFGAEYSWNNRSRSGTRTFTNIDHSFANINALTTWPTMSSFIPTLFYLITPQSFSQRDICH